jgi:hypothetical protein
MIKPMAVIHISEAEAAKDFRALAARARAGEDVYIDDGTITLRLAKVPYVPSVHALKPRYTEPRLASEILADLERNASSATLDDKFGDDLEAVIRSHEHETLIDPWESS